MFPRISMRTSPRFPLDFPIAFLNYAHMPALLSPTAIEALAAQANLSMAEVCRRAGVSQSTFTRWKAGKTEPTLDVYRKLCAAIPPTAAPTEPGSASPSAGRYPDQGSHADHRMMIPMPRTSTHYGFAEPSMPYRFAAAAPDAETQALEILARLDRELLEEEARADRLLRAYSR
jgi:transcriptional regulator with XRE-family HTH domain